MKRYTVEELPNCNGCYDCNLPYGEPGWIEAIVPDEVWEIINPSYHERGGILCITCIARRCEEADLEDVPVLLCGMERLRAVPTNRALYANDSLSVRWYRIRHFWYAQWWHFKTKRMKFIGRIHDSYGDE